MTDDILDQISIRNLEAEGGPRTPLRKFTGKLEPLTTRTDNTYSKPRVIVKLSFTDVEVITSLEPYDFPIAELEVAHSQKEKSRWGIFSLSLAKLLQPEQDIKDAIGSKVEMTWTEGHLLYDGRQSKDTEQGAWEVTALDGAGATKTSPQDQALSLLDGKTLSQFNQAALADPIIRSDAALQALIMSKKWVPQMIEEGLVVADEDGIHRVKK